MEKIVCESFCWLELWKFRAVLVNLDELAYYWPDKHIRLQLTRLKEIFLPHRVLLWSVRLTSVPLVAWLTVSAFLCFIYLFNKMKCNVSSVYVGRSTLCCQRLFGYFSRQHSKKNKKRQRKITTTEEPTAEKENELSSKSNYGWSCCFNQIDHFSRAHGPLFRSGGASASFLFIFFCIRRSRYEDGGDDDGSNASIQVLARWLKQMSYLDDGGYRSMAGPQSAPPLLLVYFG